MSIKNLDIYLNDHLAGSIGALELLVHLKDRKPGEDLSSFISDLLKEIEADQGSLQSLMKQLEIGESTIRKAGAWAGEKFVRLKLQLEGDSDELGMFQGWEALAVGILAKGELWKALAVASVCSPKLRVLEYGDLQSRARAQFDSVEAKRLELASQAFSIE